MWSFSESLALFQNLSCPDATRGSSGFRSVYKPKVGGVRFADLLDQVSAVDPEVILSFQIRNTMASTCIMSTDL